jgi:hypothetical protein
MLMNGNNVGTTVSRGSWSDCNKASIYVVSVWSWLRHTTRVGPRKPQLHVGSCYDVVTSVGTGASAGQQN